MTAKSRAIMGWSACERYKKEIMEFYQHRWIERARMKRPKCRFDLIHGKNPFPKPSPADLEKFKREYPDMVKECS